MQPAEASTATEYVKLTTSDTPLAKAFRKYQERTQQRSPVQIPWGSFVRADYDAEALQLAQSQAQKLAEGEYNSVGLFGQIASGLALNGAPFDIITEATTIAHDEIRHATYTLRLAELCAGRELALPIHRSAVVGIGAGLTDVAELDYFILKYSAVGETLAASLLDTCTRRASNPVAQAVYAALAGDEIHHARLGWYYFAWRAPQWSPLERQRLSDRIGGMVIELEQIFWLGRDASTQRAREDAQALGVLDTSVQREIIHGVVTQEILPGLDALGLGASHAWNARKRAQP